MKRPLQLLAILATLLQVTSANAQTRSATTDATYLSGIRADDWDEGFSFALLDREVHAAVFDGAGGFYVGGEFSGVGRTAAQGIAHWDGTEWSAVGEGLGEEAAIYALAMGPDGSLYAGGEFLTTGNGLTVNNIARWDGTSWTALDSGLIDTSFDATVEALAVDLSGNVFAGGFFNRGSGVTVNRVAKWDGSSWQALGEGFNGDVLALVVASDGTVYAGGDFDETAITEVEMDYIASWNGTDWTELGGGAGSTVKALELDANQNLYVSGSFQDIGPGIAAVSIARWDGTNWHPVGTGLQREGFRAVGEDLAITADGSVFVGGVFDHAGGVLAANVARWDGTVWHALGEGTSDDVLTIAVGTGGLLFVGGSFVEAGGTVVNFAGSWDGTTWGRFGNAQNGINQGVFALEPDGVGGVYATGSFSAAGTNPVNMIAHWTGDEWSDLGDGLGHFLTGEALASDGAGGLYAGGSFLASAGAPADYLAYWDGSTWSGVGQAPDARVYALAFADDGTLYAGGNFDEIGGVETGLASWDGTSWTGLADANSLVTSLAVADDGTLYAAGGIRFNAGLARVAQWDGTNWTAIASPFDTSTQPEVLVVGPDGMLYAGGRFTTIGGVETTGIARWDGTTWSDVGGGVTGTSGPAPTTVMGIAFDDAGRLYAAGTFTTAGGVAANNIARWDGSVWQPLGSGLEGNARALAFAGGPDVWVGGYLTSAGGVESVNIARWRGAAIVGIAPDDAVRAGTLIAYPNPLQTSTRVELTLINPSAPARIDVFNLLGRRVASLYDGPLAAGTHAFQFDATEYPAGLYLVRVSTPKATMTRLLTVVR